MYKRFIAGLLTLALALSGMPTTKLAQAAGETTSEVGEQAASAETVLGNDVSISATNSFGTLVADELSATAAEQTENAGYNVFSIEMDGKDAEVSFETLEDATLVVAVYDEAGSKLLGSGSAEVASTEKTASVTVEIDAMPQYFYLRGYLVDTDSLRPLCTVYESPMYTEEMQAFLAKTTKDFDADKVLNLDEDQTNNFAVYADDTIIIPQKANVNSIQKMDEEAEEYVIGNADAHFTTLQEGDVFAYEYGDGELLIVKVASIDVDGTTVSIMGEDTSMEDVFSYVKIDVEQGVEDAVIDDSTCAEGVTYEGLVEDAESFGLKNSAMKGVSVEAETEKFMGLTLASEENKEKDGLSVTGKLGMKISCTAKLYLTSSEQYFELKLDYCGGASVSLQGKGKVDFPIVTVGFMYSGVIVEVTPSLLLEVNANVSVSGTLKGTVGFRATGEGIDSLTSMPSFDTEFKAEGSVYIGFSLEPRIKILSEKVADASLTAKVGAEVTAKMDNDRSESGDEIHTCAACLEGVINAKLDLNAGVQFFNSVKLKFTLDLPDFEEKIADFYYSADHNEFGMFATCPYRTYRIGITVLDANGNKVSDALVMEQYTTDENGQTELYLQNGTYKITAQKTGYQTGKYSLLVAGKAEDIVIRLQKQGSSGSGSTFITPDAESGEEDSEQSEDAEQSADAEVSDITNEVVSVSLGSGHSGAITADGDLYMWGENISYQLGDGSISNRDTPVKVLENVVSVSLGTYHSGAITADGDLYMWGSNSYGQLGDGTILTRRKPVKVLEDVVSVSLGGLHSGAITSDGDLYMWGNNWYGQLGDETITDRHEPVKVLENVVSVSLGEYHSGAITADGSLYMWGYNICGQLGDGSISNRDTPVKVLENVVSVSLGTYHSGAITADGDLYMWGDDNCGQLGDGTKSGRRKPNKVLEDVVEVSLGSSHSGAITEDGDLYMWGYNSYGQIGDETTTSRYMPVKVLENAASVSLGEYHSGAITSDGSLYMWGYNKYGQLGDGTTTDSYVPIQITIPTTTSTKSLSAKVTADLETSALKKASDDTQTSVTFDNLTANDTYNYYVVRSLDAEALLSAENLLYIGQSAADASGNMTVSYEAKEEVADAVVFAVGASRSSIADASIKAKKLTYTGKEQMVKLTVTDQGKTLTEGQDYQVSGAFAATKPGIYTVTVQGIGTYTGTVEKTYRIVPKGTSLKSVKASGKALTVKWKKQTKQVSGYQIQYSTGSKFTKKKTKTVKVANAKVSKKKLTGLKANKTYSVRIRTYKTVKVNGKAKKVYSAWSKVKKATM